MSPSLRSKSCWCATRSCRVLSLQASQRDQRFSFRTGGSATSSFVNSNKTKEITFDLPDERNMKRHCKTARNKKKCRSTRYGPVASSKSVRKYISFSEYELLPLCGHFRTKEYFCMCFEGRKVRLLGIRVKYISHTHTHTHEFPVKRHKRQRRQSAPFSRQQKAKEGAGKCL